MSEFKPTAPGWYWAKGESYRKPEIFRVFMELGGGSLGVKLGKGIVPIDSPSIGPFEWLAPVVPFEDGPGVNQVQQDCLETALETANIGYCVIGGVDEGIEKLAEYWRGLTDAQRMKFSKEIRGLIQTTLMLGAQYSSLKKALRAGTLPPLPDPSPEAIEKIAQESMDVGWYHMVTLKRCGWTAAKGYAWLREKLSKRKASGTLAATGKREEDE